MWGVVRGRALIGLWHFRAIEQVLAVGEPAPAIRVRHGIRLLAPDEEEHRDTGKVRHNATTVVEGHGHVTLQAMPMVLAVVPGLEGKSPGTMVTLTPRDLHSLLALMA